eukprot:snap_masked-scaffold_28-processed-gene-1.5-mRNA-1 protein AED:1.00 eAED:1.00 QI:0/0/0/0/1/1/2/0/137
MLKIKHSNPCEPPFLQNAENICNTTVAEFYEPFSYYLRIISTVVDITVLLLLFGILISFLKAHKIHFCKSRKVPQRTTSDKRKYFFKYNLLTIVFLITGIIFHTHLSYNNFLYDLEFTSNLAKRNAICVEHLPLYQY